MTQVSESIQQCRLTGAYFTFSLISRNNSTCNREPENGWNLRYNVNSHEKVAFEMEQRSDFGLEKLAAIWQEHVVVWQYVDMTSIRKTCQL